MNKPYDPWDYEQVKARLEKHRREVHGGDMEGFYDCASCGALEARFARLHRAYEQAQRERKQ